MEKIPAPELSAAVHGYTPACSGKNVRTHNKNPSFSSRPSAPAASETNNATQTGKPPPPPPAGLSPLAWLVRVPTPRRLNRARRIRWAAACAVRVASARAGGGGEGGSPGAFSRVFRRGLGWRRRGEVRSGRPWRRGGRSTESPGGRRALRVRSSIAARPVSGLGGLDWLRRSSAPWFCRVVSFGFFTVSHVNVSGIPGWVANPKSPSFFWSECPCPKCQCWRAETVREQLALVSRCQYLMPFLVMRSCGWHLRLCFSLLKMTCEVPTVFRKLTSNSNALSHSIYVCHLHRLQSRKKLTCMPFRVRMIYSSNSLVVILISLCAWSLHLL